MTRRACRGSTAPSASCTGCNATPVPRAHRDRRRALRRPALDARRPPRCSCRTSTSTPGLLLPIPVLVGIAARARARSSAPTSGRLNRWDRRRPRLVAAFAARRACELGKFNPGQKLNAAFIGAAIVVMLGDRDRSCTGSSRSPTRLAHRRDVRARLVRDRARAVAIAGHIVLAFADPDALRGIVRGWVQRRVGADEPTALVRRDRRASRGDGRRRRLRGRRRRGTRRAAAARTRDAAHARWPSSTSWHVAPGIASAIVALQLGPHRAVVASCRRPWSARRSRRSTGPRSTC